MNAERRPVGECVDEKHRPARPTTGAGLPQTAIAMGQRCDDVWVDRGQVFFCSRTHSQLSQVIQEIGRTPFKDSLSFVPLGSRKVSLPGAPALLVAMQLAVQNVGKHMAYPARGMNPSAYVI